MTTICACDLSWVKLTFTGALQKPHLKYHRKARIHIGRLLGTRQVRGYGKQQQLTMCDTRSRQCGIFSTVCSVLCGSKMDPKTYNLSDY
jgi:hypothetical protein